jgi:hypothetical protein
MSVPAPFVERRQFGRRNTAIHGWIMIEGRPKLPTLVRNVSDGGALLEGDVPAWLPFRFQLVIECKGFSAWCEVRHSKERWIGVRFVRVDAEPVPIASWAPHVEDTWTGERKPLLVK